MPRRSYSAHSLPATIRAHFGLTQAELARFVGVSREQLANAEAGRRALSDGPEHRLWVLARQLPPPSGKGPKAPVFATGAAEADLAPDLPGVLDPNPLRSRLRRCRFYAVKARYELDQRGQWAQSYARRRWAVEVLRPALTTPEVAPAGTLPSWFGATPDPAADLHWLEGLVIHLAATTVPLTPTQRALLLARLRALDAEIAALEEILAEPEQP